MGIRSAFPALAAAFAASTAAAQVPHLLGYQGRLLRADGSAATGTAGVAFSVWDAATGGSRLWGETQTLGLSDGYYATFLGLATTTPDGLFDGPARWIEIQVGGETLAPRQQVGAVPYAATAQSVVGSASVASLRVGGQVVFGSDGRLAGPARYSAGAGIAIDPSQTISLAPCSAGQTLAHDATSWFCAPHNDGTVTTVGAAAPLAVTDGTSTPQLSITQAGASSNGYLSSADWYGFNAKYGAGTQCGGDLTGPMSAPTVVRLQSRAVSAAAPGPGQVLKWSAVSTQWEPGADQFTNVTASAPLTAQGSGSTSVQLSMLAAGRDQDGYLASADWAAFEAKAEKTCGGDLSGSLPSPAVVALQSHAVSADTPQPGQVLYWDGLKWTPTTLESTDVAGLATGYVALTGTQTIGGSKTFATPPAFASPLPVSSGGLGTTAAAANTVFAGPDAAAGAPVFRRLAAGDLPALDASALTIGTLSVQRGGTGIGSFLVGDLLYASAPGALAPLSAAGTGNVLLSGGVNTAPSWGKVTTAHISALGTGDSTTFLRGDGQWAPEADPKIGSLGTGKWCTSNGTQVACTTDPPDLGAKVDRIDIAGGSVGSSTAIPVLTINSQGQVVGFSTAAPDLGGKVDKINVAGGTAGSSTAIPVLTVNSQGQVTGISAVAVDFSSLVRRSGDTMSGNLDMSGGSGVFTPPVGTTAQRPASPAAGQMRWNTTLGVMEFFTGTTWYGINAPPFSGGNVNSTSVQAVAQTLLTAASTPPSTGGALTVNGVAMGNYDYTVKQGAQTVSAFTNSDWFTGTSDTAASFVVVNGDLTIAAGQTFAPANRKLFTVLYVAGNLTVNGTISMTARGANHSATAAGTLLLAAGTFGGVVNPQVPAAGGAGAADTAITAGTGTSIGTAGTAGTAGGTGGGGGGGNQSSSVFTRSAGSAGTSFGGGSGGGATIDNSASAANNASANGGAGGAPTCGGYPCGGGAGNPGGTGVNGGSAGTSGTGGVLVIYCTGTLSGSGTIAANGSPGGSASGNGTADSGGGGSGGGSVTVFYGTDTSSIVPTATGGAGGTGAGAYNGTGGAGGNGTARKLPLNSAAPVFGGGNLNTTSVQAAAQFMLTASAAPTAGGTLAVNGVAVGSYDYTVKQGAQTVSAFTSSDWFTGTGDTAAAFVVVNGDLTVNAGQTFAPANRKLFTVLYVAGNLTVNGAISMTARGASHGATPAGNLLLASGTFGGVANPQVPAAGGAGAANTAITAGTGTSYGTAGTAGTAGGTGGGGGGGNQSSSVFTRSAGSAGTSYSGGSGGGATIDTSYSAANNGAANGGAGGAPTCGGYPCGGGAGNPGGSGVAGGSAGTSGTGGVLVVYCTGTLSGSGTVSANGSPGGSASGNGTADSGGGGSGGGSVTVFYGTDSGSIVPTATGGAGGTGAGAYNGTARKLSL